MPVATPFTFFGSTSFTDPDAVMFTGFPFLLDKVDVSTYDFWTTLSGWSKVDEPVSVELKAQSINDSREKASKLFWNYNGHSVDFESGGTLTLTIDIEQDEFDGGTVTAPFEPESRACEASGWEVSREVEDVVITDIEVDIYPIRMYNGTTDNEDNFVGYGFGGSAFSATDVSGAFRFHFSSYRDDDPAETWTFEYSDAINLGGLAGDMWFVASAESNSGSTSIDGLEATFGGSLTVTYKDFDIWTYPA